MRSPKHQRGYSLTELLVVISLIGILSLVAVPSFMSLMNTNRMAATIRQFASDVRQARGRAVSSGRPTKISMTPGTAPAAAAESYSLYDCTSIDSTGKVTCSTTAVWTHAIDNTTWFHTTTTFTDVDATADGPVDIVFQANGTLPTGAPANPLVVVRSSKKILFNEADFKLNVAGTVTTTKTSF